MFEELRAKYRNQVFSLYFLMFVIWILVALGPVAYALMQAYLSSDGTAHFGTNAALWMLTSIAVLFGGIISVLAQPFDYWILSSLLRGRPPQDDEQRIVDALDALALATGDAAPRLQIIPTNSINAIAIGRKKRSTLLVTSGAASLPRPELEALLAIPLARIAMGRASCARVLLLVAMPVLLLFAVLAWCLKLWKVWLVVVPVSFTLSIAGLFVFNSLPWPLQALEIAAFLIPVLLVFCFASSGPWTFVWWGLLLGTRIMTDWVSRPAAIDADIGAVTLTRYPPPLVALLERSKTENTALPFLAFPTWSLWVLPNNGNKAQKLRERIQSMEAFIRSSSPAGA